MQNYPEHNIIVADAAKKNGKPGAAYIDIDSGFSASYKLHSHTSVIEAEAYALFIAILYFWKNQIKKVVVINDSKFLLR